MMLDFDYDAERVREDMTTTYDPNGHYDAVVSAATAAGRAGGADAYAQWRVITGGDLGVYVLPWCDLSGTWAGDPTSADVVRAALHAAGVDVDRIDGALAQDAPDIVDAYVYAYDAAVATAAEADGLLDV